MASVHDFTMTDIDGNDMPLSQYEGQVVLLVNVASECGMTPQYEGLQSLHGTYADRGFKVVGLPCNQFGSQEPGSEADIKQFCDSRFSVTFPMTSKIEVNGENRHDLYRHLAGEDAAFSGDITWNFEKFLVGKSGEVLQRFEPKTEPLDTSITAAIDAALGE